MEYGFIVLFADFSGAKYRYYAQYSKNKEEAKQAFHIDRLLNNDWKLKIIEIKPAEKFDWDYFEWHGDCYNPPNAKHGVSKKNKTSKSEKPQVRKKSSPYSVRF